ncbi:MAG: S8 family peptidase [Pyrinomonadaceae bacterium]|nr:S8 family peptidase [Sphingobacteriaceae bacterium]
MKKIVLNLFLLFTIFDSQAQNRNLKGPKPFKMPDGITVKDYLPNVIIVKLKEAASNSKTFSASPAALLKSSSILSISQKFPAIRSFAETSRYSVKDTIGLNRIYEAKIRGSIETVINQLLLNPQVEYAEPSYIHRTSYIPNDPLYTSGQQTYLDLIQAPSAWNVVRNTRGVIIGIVDSGSELLHEDLAANIYYNTADPINGIDDDRDGYTDNFAGWDFVGASSTNIVGDSDPNVKSKSADHGVHVSGLAGAVTDNAKGVASISFNNARLLIVKAGPDNDGTEILKGYEGIKYAADHGASVINCSWGSEGGGSFGQDIINYAINKGCLIVAAAGNDGGSQKQYPAAYEGVLAVANTQLDDTKASSSNFGSYISLTAPGTFITSTVFNNQYQAYTGTSMSAPVVSGAAALVKSALSPAFNFNMQQIGELLRVTADNIDARNPDHVGLLGKGRLNVQRALTESPPSVRILKVMEEEKRAALSQSPDTLYLYFDLKNFLFPVTNLQLNLSTTNSLVSVLVAQKSIGSLGTLETLPQVGPFKVAVPAGTPSNSEINFMLNYSANNNTYQDFESITVVVARDYLDVTTNSVITTITSNGRIGFSEPSAENGSGFIYKNDQLLYEASLMIGKSAEMVSNNTRSGNSQYDEHFVKKIRSQELVNNTDSTRAKSEFDESASPLPLNIYVEHTILAYKQAPDDKYVIAEYEVFNKSNSNANGLYVGLFTDWDIQGGSTNSTEYDVSRNLGYVYEKQQAGNFAGVKLLSNNAPPLYYPLSYMLTNNLLSDDDFTIAEKWETLSSGIHSTSLGTTTNGIDVSFVSGNGPYDITANGSIKVAFALIGGDNLQDLQNSAQQAQARYDAILASQPQVIVTEYSMKNYPNPVIAGATNTVQFSLPEDTSVSLELYNVLGQRVHSFFEDRKYRKGMYQFVFNLNDSSLAGINSGLYFYRLKYNSGSRTSRVSILK